MEDTNRYSETKTPMRFALAIETLFSVVSLSSIAYLLFIVPMSAIQSPGVLMVMVYITLAALGVFYIPGFIINLILYQRIHKKGIPPKKARRVFNWHLVYAIINLLVLNALLGALYLITYAKGSKAVERRVESVYHRY